MEIGSQDWKETIIEGARTLGITVRSGQAELFAAHALILKEWNQKMNLTAIESPEDMAIKHFLDAIVPSRYIDPDSSLLDVGSGAGFPGIPLKVMIPSLGVTLVDATRKKVSFLNHVIRQLRLHQIDTVHARIETLPQRAEKMFDIIVCRAFSSLASFVEKSLPLLAPDGLMIAYKSRGYDSDLSQMSTQLQDGKTALAMETRPETRLQIERLSFTLPVLEQPRTLILLRRW